MFGLIAESLEELSIFCGEAILMQVFCFKLRYWKLAEQIRWIIK